MAIDLKTIVRRGKSGKPPRCVVYGPAGIGKSTFAAESGALIIPCEDGLGGIESLKTEPVSSLDEVLDIVDSLLVQDHKITKVAIDTLDALERMVWDRVVANHNEQNPSANFTHIEDFGYGRGYKFAMAEFRKLLVLLDKLRNERGMMVILIAHAMIKRYEDPLADPYDRYQLKMHEKTAELITEWSDIVGFANLKTATKATSDKDAKRETRRAVSVGGTVLHLRRTPTFDAKNRYGMPDVIPFRWSNFAEAMEQ